jgi:hypothetical protein
MSEVKNQTRYSGVDRRAPRSEPGVLKQGAVARDLYKTGGRHAAITNNLYNWHSYKNWAEEVTGKISGNRRDSAREPAGNPLRRYAAAQAVSGSGLMP